MLVIREHRTETVPFISSLDSAIGDNCDWDGYLKTGDEGLLRLSAQPTRFMLRPLNEAQRAAAIDYVGRGDYWSALQQRQAVPDGFVREAARYAVADIENPDPTWGKTIVVRERGYSILAREVVDRIPYLACLEIALKAIELGDLEAAKKN